MREDWSSLDRRSSPQPTPPRARPVPARSLHRARCNCPAGASGCLVGGGRLNALVTDDAARIGKAGKHVFALEPRIGTQQIIDRVTRRQHAEYVLDGQAPASDNRLAAEDLRIDRDSLEKIGFVHAGIVRPARGRPWSVGRLRTGRSWRIRTADQRIKSWSAPSLTRCLLARPRLPEPVNGR